MSLRTWKLGGRLAAIGLGLTLVSACGGNTAPQAGTDAVKEKDPVSGVVRIAVYSFPLNEGIDPATGRNMKGIKQLFQPLVERHPDLKLEFSEVPAEDRKAKFQALLLSESADVLFLDSAIDFYNQGFLYPLDEFLARDNWKSNFYDSLWSDPERFTNRGDGKVMAMPGGLNTGTIVYDKQLFEDWGVPPLSDKPTAAEVIEKAAKLTGINPKTGKPTYGMYYDPRAHSHTMLDYFSDGNGFDMGETDWANFGSSKLNFNTPQIRKTMETLIEISKYMPPGYEIGRGFENWGKSDNNVAMCLRCFNMDEVLKNKLTDRYVATKGLRDNIGKTTIGTAGTFSIAKKTKNPEASWAVLKYLTGEQGQKFMYDNYQRLPSWKQADWVDDRTNPYAKQLMAVVADTKNVVFPPIMFSTIRPWMADLISRATRGQKYDLESELADIQVKVQRWVEEQKAIDAAKNKPAK